jgi:hypothetical protein
MELESSTVSQDARPRRSKRPSQKCRENASRFEDDTRPSNDDATASEIEVSSRPKITSKIRTDRVKGIKEQELEPIWVQTIIKMIQSLQQAQAASSAELQRTRDELQKTHSELSSELQKIRTELQKTQTELQKTQTELQKNQSELKEAQEQLHIIKFNQEQQSPQPSYANIARTPPTSVPSNIRSLSTESPAPSTFTDTPFCTIDTSRTPEELPEKGSPSVLRTLVEREMRKREGHEAWRCVAVSRDSKNKDRLRVICRDTEELNKVKDIAQKYTAPETRVLRDQLYPVKVDNVNRTAILDEQGNVLPGAEQALGKENDVNIAKITWLSNKDNGKAYGSMVIHVTKGSEATALLNKQFFDAAGESAYVRPYEHRTRPTQCYNCQELGHKAHSCKKDQVCAKCAKTGHSHKDCQIRVPKCIPCGGPHESYSRNCQKLYPTASKA